MSVKPGQAHLTWVERNFGYAVARAFAGHDGKSDAGTTSTYVRADVYEVAQALAALTGESHPLAEHKTEVDGPEQRLDGMFSAITDRGLS
ncbi:hypothetical protein [Verrucosispora sp. WMMD573]|uniref:hypothetical protein n=1 Tax=Verrucosispora sp. WMMD573 TaxID=3015149 RepID=UPI00248CF745|nr:hypothetical protein [Verrucosispora sp. WMMD573]WBB53824.1 hypothetical protein O7601_25205 [Verrucosispora sp. WMMD573]